MGLPNFCYHLAIKEMAINGKIRLVSLVVYNYILPRKTGKCNNLPRCGVSSDLTEHMAHLVQAAVWTAGLDDRLADSGLIPFQFRQAYAPPVGVKGQILSLIHISFSCSSSAYAKPYSCAAICSSLALSLIHISEQTEPRSANQRQPGRSC